VVFEAMRVIVAQGGLSDNSLSSALVGVERIM